jgi:hypothetical protein
MNSHHEIENLLRQMPLVRPSADLDARVMEVFAGGAADSGAAGTETRRANTSETRGAAGTETRRANTSETRGAAGTQAPRADLWGRARARRAWLVGALGGALAAAAAVALVVGLPPNTTNVTPGTAPAVAPVNVATNSTPPAGPAAQVEPVRLEQNWSEISDEGIVLPDPQTPLRAFRHRTVDRVQFFDPRRNIRMETTVPHEEVIFVKASMQ